MENEGQANSENYDGLRKKLREIQKAQKIDYGDSYHLDKFFDISMDMMCIAGIDGYFKRVNQSFSRVLGYSEKELLAKPFFEFIHPDDIDSTQNEIKRLGTGRDTLYFENRYKARDGSWKWLAWTCPGAPIGTGLLYAVARDITWQKTLEAEREQFVRDLKEAVEKIRTLKGLLPICTGCKKIRDDKGYWQQVEVYIRDHSDAKFSHGLCPECLKLDLNELEMRKKRNRPDQEK